MRCQADEDRQRQRSYLCLVLRLLRGARCPCCSAVIVLVGFLRQLMQAPAHNAANGLLALYLLYPCHLTQTAVLLRRLSGTN